MQFYAYHGYYPEEREHGNDFMVNLTLELPTTQGGESDLLDNTLNYELVYNIVKEEMDIVSHLLEHVAARIKTRIEQEFPSITTSTVRVSKKNPPLRGPVAWVSIEV